MPGLFDRGERRTGGEAADGPATRDDETLVGAAAIGPVKGAFAFHLFASPPVHACAYAAFASSAVPPSASLPGSAAEAIFIKSS
jgi:hypothetical protein